MYVLTSTLCFYSDLMCMFSPLKAGVEVLSTCVGVASSLTAAEVAMLTNAWAELLTPDSVNDDTVSYNVCSSDFALNKTYNHRFDLVVTYYAPLVYRLLDPQGSLAFTVNVQRVYFKRTRTSWLHAVRSKSVGLALPVYMAACHITYVIIIIIIDHHCKLYSPILS